MPFQQGLLIGKERGVAIAFNAGSVSWKGRCWRDRYALLTVLDIPRDILSRGSNVESPLLGKGVLA